MLQPFVDLAQPGFDRTVHQVLSGYEKIGVDEDVLNANIAFETRRKP